MILNFGLKFIFSLLFDRHLLSFSRLSLGFWFSTLVCPEVLDGSSYPQASYFLVSRRELCLFEHGRMLGKTKCTLSFFFTFNLRLINVVLQWYFVAVLLILRFVLIENFRYLLLAYHYFYVCRSKTW